MEREAKRLTPKTDVKGQEVSDEFFEVAVERAIRELNLSAEERRQLAQERNREVVGVVILFLHILCILYSFFGGFIF